jgi:hypothetical protein
MFGNTPNAFPDFRDTAPMTFGNYADQGVTFPNFADPQQQTGLFGTPGGFSNEFDVLSNLLGNLYQSGVAARLARTKPAEKPSATNNTSYQTGGSATSGLAGELTQMAVAKYGPTAGPIMAALLRAEGGLGGAIGDTHISRVGSHGPLQFYGGGGQLNNFAAALGVDLETAGRVARENPQRAVQWALENYLGNALQTGISRGESGEQLLRTVLGSQNPGALNDPTRYGHYVSALTQASQPMQGPTGVEAGMVGGNNWNIAFGFNQPYGAAQFNSAIPNHRGVDLVIPGAPNNGRGAPVYRVSSRALSLRLLTWVGHLVTASLSEAMMVYTIATFI